MGREARALEILPPVPSLSCHAIRSLHKHLLSTSYVPGHHTRATEVNKIDKNPHPGDLVSVDNGETRAINNIYNKSGNRIYLESVECYGKTKTKLSNGGKEWCSIK